MLIDCHSHDTRSDGSNSTIEMVERAKKLKLDLFTITNHDIIDSDLEVLLSDTNICTSKAVEISTKTEEISNLHIAAYSKNFSAKLEKILENTNKLKSEYVIFVITELSRLGFNISYKEVLLFIYSCGLEEHNMNIGSIFKYIYLGNQSVYNINVAENKFGIKTGMFELYNLFFNKSIYKDITKGRNYEPIFSDILGCVDEKNSIISLAHPNITFKNDITLFKKEISGLIDNGLNAIEINPTLEQDWINYVFKLKDRCGIIITMGSDCHSLGNRNKKHGDLGDVNKSLSSKDIENSYDSFRNKLNI